MALPAKASNASRPAFGALTRARFDQSCCPDIRRSDSASIQPASAVPALANVDDASISQSEEVGVTTNALFAVLPGRRLPRDRFTLVFENPFAGFERH